MRYLALACDYDGTIAHHGLVADEVVDALQRVRDSGRRLLLVTGREIEDLFSVFPRADMFDLVVGENGAVLYDPKTKSATTLAEPPPAEFIAALRQAHLEPLSTGRVIVGTREPGESVVLKTIRDLGLELQVIFNKGAVMVLPAGVNKATGLAAALKALGLSPHNVVGVGDAENDHAFLAACECGVAVANALAMLKERADLVTRGAHGDGVIELIDELLETDLARREPALPRHHILLGTRVDSTAEVRTPPYGPSILIAGSSGGGKSTLATGALERLAAAGYQFCIIDPEGDYSAFAAAKSIGTPQRAPTDEEAAHLLDDPATSVAVNMVGVRFEDRPAFFQGLMARLQELRVRTGRPHWIVVDEAHHVLPAGRGPKPAVAPPDLSGMVFITVEPDSVAPEVVHSATTIVGVGDARRETLDRAAAILGVDPPPTAQGEEFDPGAVLVWNVRSGDPPFAMVVAAGRSERLRHRRKYAEGELAPDRSFYFRGPEGKLNLRAQNLTIFLQMADGLDDETWEHHRRRGDYSTWFRDNIKDEQLAEEAARVESSEAPPRQARERIREAVERRFTLPAKTEKP